MRGIHGHIGRGLCVPGKRGPSVCGLGGGGRVDVGNGSYEWVSGRPCVQVSQSSSCIHQYPGTLTLGKYPKENIQYSNHGESLKST